MQVPFAAQIRREAGIGTMAVGVVTEPCQAEEVIARWQADLFALANAAPGDPHLPLHAQQMLGAARPDSAHADWNVQAGWWLDHREDKLRQLGPWVSTEETVADSRSV